MIPEEKTALEAAAQFFKAWEVAHLRPSGFRITVVEGDYMVVMNDATGNFVEIK